MEVKWSFLNIEKEPKKEKKTISNTVKLNEKGKKWSENKTFIQRNYEILHLWEWPRLFYY